MDTGNWRTILKVNWFHFAIVIFLVFGAYWFALRPAEIRKMCSIVKGHRDAITAVPATSNWPACESSADPKDTKSQSSDDCYGPQKGTPAKDIPLATKGDGTVIMSQYIDAVPARAASSNWPDCNKPSTPKNPFDNPNPVTCHGAIETQPAKDWERSADSETYSQCLREHGL